MTIKCYCTNVVKYLWSWAHGPLFWANASKCQLSGTKDLAQCLNIDILGHCEKNQKVTFIRIVRHINNKYILYSYSYTFIHTNKRSAPGSSWRMPDSNPGPPSHQSDLICTTSKLGQFSLLIYKLYRGKYQIYIADLFFFLYPSLWFDLK